MSDKDIIDKANTNLRQIINRSGMTREQIAKAIDCDTSSITKYYNGVRKPSTDIVIKLSKLFNVSTDYLLGLTDVATSDTDLKAICDYTGLDEDSIEKIRCMHSDFLAEIREIKEENEYMRIMIDKGLSSYSYDVFKRVLNGFISSDCFERIIERLFDEVSRLQDYNDVIFSIIFDENFDVLKSLAQYDLTMFYHYWFEIRQMAKGDLKRDHICNLFELQEHIKNYAKSIAESVEDFDDYDSADIGAVFDALYEVSAEHLPKLDEDVENNKKNKQLANTIIKDLNKNLKSIIELNKKQRKWMY